jgi:hypothetical protein
MKCFNCGEKEHLSRNYLHKEKEGDDNSPMAVMPLDTCCTCTNGQLHEFYKVCIDNGSQVNIVNSRLLSCLRTSCKSYCSMNQCTETNRVGYLDGFFDCQACDDSPTSIISLADIDDIYQVTYVQGESFTVHMDDHGIFFMRRDTIYIVDFSDWIVGNKERVQQMHTNLCLMTVTDMESLYTCKLVRKVLEAGEFLPLGTLQRMKLYS